MSRKKWVSLAICTGLIQSACAPGAYANSCMPMIMVMAPSMWSALVLVIPLEAFCAKKILSTTWENSWGLSIVANLISALIGMPLTWLALMILQLVAWTKLPEPFRQAIDSNPTAQVILTAPMLYPNHEEFYWMLPVASMLLLIPFFFVTVWSEYQYAKFALPNVEKRTLLRWTWLSNCFSYLLLVILGAIFLVVCIQGHATQSAN